MKGLLNQKRVEQYLDMGLEDEPETPCGKYIGGVAKTENGYKKFFSQAVGKASHNSNLMVNRRQERKDRLRAAKQQEIESMKAKMTALQSEIDDISK